MCGPSHPGRTPNGLRVEGRKEGGGGRRAEPRQLEFLRRKDRARRESLLPTFRETGNVARARSLARSLVSFAPTSTRGNIAPSLSLSPLLFSRSYEKRRRSLLSVCLRSNSGSPGTSRRGRRRRRNERARGREGRNARAECRLSRVGRGTKKKQPKREAKKKEEERTERGVEGEGGGLVAGRLRTERSLARSRVARGLLCGREGLYRCRSRRFRAASLNQSRSFTELGCTAGQSGA